MKPRTPARSAEPARRAPLATAPFIAVITAYRWVLSPLLGPRCRYTPSCSEYALDAYRGHGAVRGTLLTLKRLLRCHPWGSSGYDPVPEPTGPRSPDSARA